MDCSPEGLGSLSLPHNFLKEELAPVHFHVTKELLEPKAQLVTMIAWRQLCEDSLIFSDKKIDWTQNELWPGRTASASSTMAFQADFCSMIFIGHEGSNHVSWCPQKSRCWFVLKGKLCLSFYSQHICLSEVKVHSLFWLPGFNSKKTKIHRSSMMIIPGE